MTEHKSMLSSQPLAEQNYKHATSKLLTAEVAALITVGLLLIAGLITLFYKAKCLPVDYGVHPYLLDYTNTKGDCSAKRVAHRFIVIATAAIVMLAPLVVPAIGNFVLRHKKSCAGVLASILACFFVSTFFITDTNALIFGAVSFFLLLFCSQNRTLWAPVQSIDFRLVQIAICILAIAPLVFLPLDLSIRHHFDVVDIQSHYSTVVMPGDRLAAGEMLFMPVRLSYGWVLSCLFGAWQKFVSPLSFGQCVSVIRVLQAACIAAFCLLFTRFARKASLPSFLPLALLLPWIHPNSIGVTYPNLSCARLCGFAVALGGLFLLRRTSGPLRTLGLGILSGVSLAINTETGLAITIGLLAFAAVSNGMLTFQNIGKKAVHLLLFCGGILTVGAIWTCFIRVSFGYWPNFSLYQETWQHLSRVIKVGHGGSAFQYEPIALLMLAQSIYCLLRLTAKRSALGFNDSFRVAVASTSIIWFAYYFNRPTTWCLVGQFMLYGFILSDTVRVINIQLRHRTSRLEPLLPAALAACLVVIPIIFYGVRLGADTYLSGLNQFAHGPMAKDAVKVSDVLLPPTVAQELIRKADFLRRQAKSGPVTYLSSNTVYLYKLSGVPTACGQTDLFQDLVFDFETVDFVKQILGQSPEYIYFDDPQSLTAGDDWRKQCFTELRFILKAHYKKVTTTDCWEVWKRK